MRRNIAWLSATVVLVALLFGYQYGYAGTASDDGDRTRACPTASAAAIAADPTASQCDPGTDDRTGGDTGTHVDKPGENK